MKTKFLTTVILLISNVLFAQNVPNLISYSAKIANDTGGLINGPVSIEFRIYNVETGGTPLWSETQSPVFVSNGLFNVFLGAVNAFSDTLFNDPNLWVGIKINSDNEMVPRNRFGCVPYALTDNDWIVKNENVFRENGNVGIGVNNPERKLTIKQSYQGDGISAEKGAVSYLNRDWWTDIYQMEEFESGLYYASGMGGYGGGYFMFIYYNYSTAPTTGYLSIIASGGDTSSYQFYFQLTSSGMVIARQNALNNDRPLYFIKIGGFNN